MAGRLLITGIDGFIGQQLSQHATRAGFDVCGIAPFDQDDESILTVDIRDRQACLEAFEHLQPDYVVHFAAISFVPHESVEDIYSINVVGSQNIMEACAQYPQLKKVFLASSAAVYGNAGADPIDESAPLAPANHYAISKLAMENIASLWNERVPTVIGRLFNCTGAGQNPKFLVPKLVKHFVEKAERLELGNTDVIRDFSDVRFTADAILQLLLSEQKSTVFNICSGQGWSLQDILNELEKLTGFCPQVETNPAFVRAGDIPVLIGDNSKLCRYLPDLKPVPFEETLAAMCGVAVEV